jgi:MFS family permease
VADVFSRTAPSTAASPRLGLGVNARQFWLLVLVNAFVGSLVGLERDVLPLVGRDVFGIPGAAALASFVVAFGITKALVNAFAGRLADRVGRKPVLVAGWLVALPIPFLLMFAPSWGWIVFANVLLGVNQGCCWSMTVVMKIDLVGPSRRGFAMGLNEFAGYLAVGVAAYASGALAQAYGLRPWPFAAGVVFAVAGLVLSAFAVRETHGHARGEALQAPPGGRPAPTFRALLGWVSWRQPTLATVSQAGLVNNLNDGLAWALLPLYFSACGLDVGRIAVLAAVYPAAWGILQLVTGALSDRVGRKWLIASGMWVQAFAIALFLVRGSFVLWFAAAVLLGVGTAMVYPTLLAAIGDVVHPLVRGSAVGIYRLWRDAGYAFGALVAGLVAQHFGAFAAIGVVAALTFLSGVLVAARMAETRSQTAAWEVPS